jgi:phytoene dehydrogenase-like protein
MSTLGVKLNCYYPVGGAQKLADLLVQGIVNYNSELALNTLVGRILIENKKAIGVELASGEEIRSKWVISNADARQTFIELVGETALSPKFIRELAEARLSSSAFLISLGTTLDLKSLGFDGATVIYNPTDDPEELFGADLEKHLISIKMHSLLDPSQSPRNMSAIQIMMMLPYDFSPGWEKDKEAIADKLIASAEEVIPNLTDYIICREITTPLTLEGTTLNSQGAIGWYPAPRGKMWRQKAPIKNLYQAGQWTFPGAGVPNAIASGRNATQLVLRNR